MLPRFQSGACQSVWIRPMGMKRARRINHHIKADNARKITIAIQRDGITAKLRSKRLHTRPVSRRECDLMFISDQQPRKARAKNTRPTYEQYVHCISLLRNSGSGKAHISARPNTL